jgi:hypothetical protein
MEATSAQGGPRGGAIPGLTASDPPDTIAPFLHPWVPQDPHAGPFPPCGMRVSRH